MDHLHTTVYEWGLSFEKDIATAQRVRSDLLSDLDGCTRRIRRLGESYRTDPLLRLLDTYVCHLRAAIEEQLPRIS